MTIGSKIRFHRLKRNLTQEDLSKGIISVSYLSKLENNQVTPSNDIINLLCDRLGVNNLLDTTDHLNKLLEKWNHALLWNKTEDAKSINEVVKKDLDQTDDLIPHLFYKILCFRVQLIKGNLQNALDNMKQIQSNYKELTDALKFYYHKYKGNYDYLIKEYDKAIGELKEAEKRRFELRRLR